MLSDAYIQQQNKSSLIQMKACCPFGTMPLSEYMLTYFSEILIKSQIKSEKKSGLKMLSASASKS